MHDNGWRIIDVNECARKAELYRDYDVIADTTDVDTDMLSQAIRQDLAGGRKSRTAIVGHLAPYAVPDSVGVALAVILRRNPRDLTEVYKDRGYAQSKSRQNAGAEALGIIAHDTLAASYARTIQFDTTHRNPKETADMILGALNDTTDGSNNARQGDSVDWLADNSILQEPFMSDALQHPGRSEQLRARQDATAPTSGSPYAARYDY